MKKQVAECIVKHLSKLSGAILTGEDVVSGDVVDAIVPLEEEQDEKILRLLWARCDLELPLSAILHNVQGEDLEGEVLELFEFISLLLCKDFKRQICKIKENRCFILPNNWGSTIKTISILVDGNNAKEFHIDCDRTSRILNVEDFLKDYFLEALFLHISIVKIKPEIKKRLGRPEVGQTRVNVRLDNDSLRLIDEFCAVHNLKNRSEAIRRLMKEKQR